MPGPCPASGSHTVRSNGPSGVLTRSMREDTVTSLGRSWFRRATDGSALPASIGVQPEGGDWVSTKTAHVPAPGTERPRRYRPKLRYELIGCGLHGHELLGTDAAALRAGDGLFARESGGLRWYRCLRCDSWIPLSPPDHPERPYPPPRSEVQLPLRGRPLRDRYVLRLVAVERVLHFVVLSALAAAVFVFASNKAALDTDFTRALKYVQGGLGGPMTDTNHGIVHDLQRLFGFSLTNLYLAGTAIAAYALLEGVEAVGLWFGRRWAEYLTL